MFAEDWMVGVRIDWAVSCCTRRGVRSGDGDIVVVVDFKCPSMSVFLIIVLSQIGQ